MFAAIIANTDNVDCFLDPFFLDPFFLDPFFLDPCFLDQGSPHPVGTGNMPTNLLSVEAGW
jgi:hypothetical protein